MSTNGAYGYHYKGKDFVTYNHSDSYYEYLGVNVLHYVGKTAIDKMKKIVSRINLVNDEVMATPEHIKLAKKYELNDSNIYGGAETDYYALLRNGQGDLSVLETVPIMIENSGFLGDSLFCEYAYIINLDTEEVEIYRGFNTKPNGAGRYAKLKDDDYYGVKLVKTISISAVQGLSNDEIDSFIKKLANAEKK